MLAETAMLFLCWISDFGMGYIFDIKPDLG